MCVGCPLEVQHVRNCPIDCASLYYNGVHRSGVYTVVPSLGSLPVEVYCDMETEGETHTHTHTHINTHTYPHTHTHSHTSTPKRSPVLTCLCRPGGGWTVFQRRQDGKVNFNRNWQDYRDGFGELRAEHWLGNDHLHHLTGQGDYSLRIDLEDWTHKHKHALYQSFRWQPHTHTHTNTHIH